MFNIATYAEIEELADFSWKIQSNIKTASYPIDKYKCRQDMIDTLRTYLKGNPTYPDDTVLVLREDTNPVATVILAVERENLYLQTAGVYAANNLPHVYNELKSWCHRHFNGYNLHIGLPMENDRACSAALAIGGKLIESSDFFRLEPAHFMPILSTNDIRLLCIDNFESFAIFIDNFDKTDKTDKTDKVDETDTDDTEDANDTDDTDDTTDAAMPSDEIYWNAERIRKQFDKWRIYTLHFNDEMVGCATFINTASYKNIGEIFRCSTLSPHRTIHNTRALLSKGITSAFADGKAYILYSVEPKETIEREAAIQCGFKQTGSYGCYRIACV